MEIRREFWVSDPPEEAVRKIRMSLQRIGEVTEIVPGQQVNGKIAFGVQAAQVQISWSEEIEIDPLEKPDMPATARHSIKLRGTRVTIKATSVQSDQAARSATERFEDAYLHYTDPTYRPDRLGIMPASIVGVLVIILLLGIMLWRIPQFRKLLPNIHPHIVPAAAPLPTPTPDETETNSTSTN